MVGAYELIIKITFPWFRERDPSFRQSKSSYINDFLEESWKLQGFSNVWKGFFAR